MRLRNQFVALSSAILFAACSTDVALAPTKTPGRLSLSVSSGVAPTRHVVSLQSANSLESFTQKVASLGGTVVSFHRAAGIAVVSGLTDAGASQLAAAGVGTAMRDFVFSPFESFGTAEADASDVATDRVNSQTRPDSAGRYAFQWNMRLIHADSVMWKLGHLGSSSVTAAIIDTGLDYDAPDLNGLVDLSRSVSFMNHFVGHDLENPDSADYTPIVPSDDEIVGFFPGRNLITDLNGHGTNVATQVSSKARALAGVTSKTTLIGVKVLGANGYGSFSDILNGVLWAADHGADVANMSLGGGFSKAANGFFLSLINRTFNYAASKGMIVVVSAGNDGTNLQFIGNGYSTYCDAPNVICVSAVGPRLATTSGDEPAFYTNFGKNIVDVAAPGGNADAANGFTRSVWPWSDPTKPLTANDRASWVWSYCAKQTLVIQKSADGKNGDLFLTSCIAGNRLTGFIGTSQAAPHVTGLAALLIAEKGKMSPNNMKQLIQRSGVPTNRSFGRARIDVARALGL